MQLLTPEKVKGSELVTYDLVEICFDKIRYAQCISNYVGMIFNIITKMK